MNLIFTLKCVSSNNNMVAAITRRTTATVTRITRRTEIATRIIVTIVDNGRKKNKRPTRD